MRNRAYRLSMIPLPEERVARRAVGAVDLRVTVDAAAADQAVAPSGQLHAVVDRRRMPGADVTPLAEHRKLRDEHPVVVGPVRIVTRVARLADRRVIPQERPSLLGMAAHAG